MIQRVLVANRGEIARRVFKTCRRLSIATVAVYSDPDASEPHPAEADAAIRLPGATAAETYLNQDLILAAAKESGADAVHPGYGFLAENAGFARAVIMAGLVWIGPPPDAIAAMGSKLESKKLMKKSGVATLEAIDLTGKKPEEITAAARQIGYPVLVKASAGGGGKGMRIVGEEATLSSAVEAAVRESEKAFGDGTVFLEKYLHSPRHIEIQVLADTHGNVVSLFERECSIQRRHQKIIEESPSPAIDERMRSEMGEAAVKAADAVDYTGVGTVEFLFQNGQYYFLEMNTRLQVEHPVTEMVTGLDLVELQILVASGEQLPPSALAPTITGHAVEARLYAEDPENEYLPVTGTIDRFEFPSDSLVRVDSGVESGSEVSVHYDPMLAKVIAHGPNRGASVSTLADTLRRARIHGSKTNRAQLVRILEHPEFLAGNTDTHFLIRHPVTELAAALADEVAETYAARAAALADQAVGRANARVLRTIPTGWRNLPGGPQQRVYRGEVSEHHITYSIKGDRVGFEGEDWATLIECTPERVVFDLCGTIHAFDVARYGPVRHVDTDFTPVRLVAIPRFPTSREDDLEGSLRSPMPGKILRVDVEAGDQVSTGHILMVLEAMKMEHTISAPYAGIVTQVFNAVGDQVESGAVLAVVEPD